MPIFNYVREHRRFIRYASDHKLTSGERLLWYALVEIMNEQADGNAWTDDYIPISNNRLLTLCDPMGTDTLMRARSRLKQRGLIDFRPGSRNRENPAYRINLFYPVGCPVSTEKKEGYTQNAYNPGDNIQDNQQDNLEDNTEDNLQDNLRGRMQGNPGDIYINLNKDYTQTKGYISDDDDEDDDDSIARACARGEGESEDPVTDRAEREKAVRTGFLRAFGRIPYPAETGRLVVSGWRMGFSAEMVNKALETAAGRGANKPVDYTLAILEEWRQEEVMQPHQADEYRAAHDIETGKTLLPVLGDPEEFRKARQEAKQRRIRENSEAGIGCRIF